MINLDFFKSVKIFDGGMGQELLSRGLKSKGSLWSASALLEEKFHQIVVDSHLDFINAGANVIVTNNFSARRVRMIENNTNDQFIYANRKAGELALQARELSKKKIIISGSLPAQNDTYVEDKRDSKIIEQGFYDQAECLKEYIDFYYLDVMSSLRECIIGLSVTKKMQLPALVGLHIKSNGNLPSGEKINEVVSECKKYNILGIIISCVSPEIIEKVSEQFSKFLYEKNKEVIFIIGSSNGHPDFVRKLSNKIISLSKMTFLHEMSLLILSEQIFRAIAIKHGRKYHK